MRETQHSYFKNGVRVDVMDWEGFKEFVEGNTKTVGVVDRLTKIARLLGGAWTVARGNGDGSSYGLLYNGGHLTPEGITLHLYNMYYDDRNAGRSDYWKFDFSGSYPEPTSHADRRRPQNDVRATININDPAKAVSAIKSRLIDQVTATTNEAREYVAFIEGRNERYEAFVRNLHERVGMKLSDAFMMDHYRDLRMENGGYVRFNRGSTSIEFSMQIHEDEVDLLLEFKQRVSNLRSEKLALAQAEKEKAEQECSLPA